MAMPLAMQLCSSHRLHSPSQHLPQALTTRSAARASEIAPSFTKYCRLSTSAEIETDSADQLVNVNPRGDSRSYVPGPLDGILLNLFRKKMVQEVGWDSTKAGYDGLIEIARRLLSKHKDRAETEAATVRILRSLFPSVLLPLFRALVAPLFGGEPAAILTARVTQATCQWLMGTCSVNTIYLADGSPLESGVLVERCKYLEESKCAGICIHTCKLPTQTFMKDYMGIDLAMEPNFQDFSCQFKFGVKALSTVDDESIRTPCLEICPTAASRINFRGPDVEQCPQVWVG